LELHSHALASVRSRGYGEKPNQWASYDSGRYFDRLHQIMETYRLSDSKVDYLHYEQKGLGIGDVDLFRLSLGPECNEENCLFLLFASDLGDIPLITPCQFKRAGLAHLFNPDGTKFWGFEFSCGDDGVLQVKVTPTHFMARPIAKKP
jgi:hypothetical protein